MVATMKPLDLAGARIHRTNFRGANLTRANLENANLSGANFSDTTMRGAKLRGAIMKGTDLRGADLDLAEGLTKEQLSDAIVDERTVLPSYLRDSRAA